jgi:hypothetical protein
MTQQLKGSLRTAVTAVAIAIGGVALGLVAAPGQAAASPERTHWSCFGSDECHAGPSPCCFEIEENPPGQGHCSTMC